MATGMWMLRASVGRVMLRGAAVVIAATVLTGCESAKSLVMLPFDMAEHVAVEMVKLPYETAKLGARGVVDAASHMAQ